MSLLRRRCAPPTELCEPLAVSLGTGTRSPQQQPPLLWRQAVRAAAAHSSRRGCADSEAGASRAAAVRRRRARGASGSRPLMAAAEAVCSLTRGGAAETRTRRRAFQTGRGPGPQADHAPASFRPEARRGRCRFRFEARGARSGGPRLAAPLRDLTVRWARRAQPRGAQGRAAQRG